MTPEMMIQFLQRLRKQTQFRHDRFMDRAVAGEASLITDAEDAAEHIDALDQAIALLSAGAWQPIETVPAGVMRAILFWPAYTLDDDGNLSSGRIPANDVVAVGYRVGGQQWEGGPEIEATWTSSDDGWELGEPTHWMPLPAPPSDGDQK